MTDGIPLGSRGEGRGAPAPERAPPWRPLAWALLFVLVAAALQAWTSYPYDFDTAYHAAVGALIRRHGILHAFPWTPFSWLADHYADKELLFHLLFVPLSGVDWVTASRIVGTVAGATLLIVLHAVLRAERVAFAGLWTLLPLAASGLFAARFALVRPHVLSIALAIVILWAATRGLLVVLAAAAAVYPWCYIASWQLTALMVGAAEAARLVSQRRVDWRPAAAAAGGFALGVLAHPNASNLLAFSWLVMRRVLFRAWEGVEVGVLGEEIKPLPLADWGIWLVACVAMTGAAAVLAWRRRARDPVAVAFALAAVGFGILTVRSGRFVEYFAPFSAAALALAARELRWRWLAPAVLAGAAAYTLAFGRVALTDLANVRPDVPPEAAATLPGLIPPGAQVFTTDWDMTGALMQVLPERRFIVALEPTLFQLKDPELYRLWYELPRRNLPGAARAIRERFGARYVLSFWNVNWRPFYLQLASEPGVRTTLIADTWMFFDLGP